MEERFYAGIGSRKTPGDVMISMSHLAGDLETLAYILRSGGADGADTAFELGALTKEIFLPWEGFNKHKSVLCYPSPQAHDIAGATHPAWHMCGNAARSFHARNVHQVLGKDLKTPVDFVIYWAEHTKGIKYPLGGTGMAIRIADKHKIPFYLIGSAKCNEFLESIGVKI